MIDGAKIKADFPILGTEKNGQKLVYLDSGATSQKPRVVIEAISKYYEEMNANVHRGIYSLSEAATVAYSDVRQKVADFISAANEEIVFVRNSTEAANLIAYSFGEMAIAAGDEIIISELEHHSNFLPWLALAKRKNAIVKIWPINSNGELEVSELKKLLSAKTKILALTQMSNVLGTITPVKEAVDATHAVGGVVVLDAAQGISHLGLNVAELGVDFAFASGHKMFAGTGIGFLFGRKELLEKMPAFMTGGGMVKEIDGFDFETLDLPMKFEAGTPDIAGAISLGAAIDYLKQFSFAEILAHDQMLMKKLRAELAKIPQIKMYGPTDLTKVGGIQAISISGIHPHDIASVCNEFNVAIRAGHHCAKPLHKKLNLDASARISFHIYNTEEDIDVLISALKKVIDIFK